MQYIYIANNINSFKLVLLQAVVVHSKLNRRFTEDIVRIMAGWTNVGVLVTALLVLSTTNVTVNGQELPGTFYMALIA